MLLLWFSLQPTDARATSTTARLRMTISFGRMRLLPRHREDERIGDDDDPAARWLRELQAAHDLRDTAVHIGVVHRRVCDHRRDDRAGAGDREVDRHAAVQVGLLE